MVNRPVQRRLHNRTEEGQDDEGAVDAVLYQMHQQGHDCVCVITGRQKSWGKLRLNESLLLNG